MRPDSFDRIAQSFAERRINRRAALGMTATVGTAIGFSISELRVTAQDQVTPEATPDSGATAALADAEFLFVQTASSGTFVPNPSAGTPTADGSDEPGGGADYLLTLDGHNGHTVYFSDRPERITGVAPTDAFLEGLGFSPENPPNAALVTSGEDGETVILVVELVSPIHDDEDDSITYGATVLAEYDGSGLQHLIDQGGAGEFPESFDEASLFLDDCPDVSRCTWNPSQGGFPSSWPIPGGPYGRCWNWSKFACLPCDPSITMDDLYAICNQDPVCNGDECYPN
jgi:hypothetical protein